MQENVSPVVRVADFGKDRFFVDDGKLFCGACNEFVDNIRKNDIRKNDTSKDRLINFLL